jgi:hypothetical protein
LKDSVTREQRALKEDLKVMLRMDSQSVSIVQNQDTGGKSADKDEHNTSTKTMQDSQEREENNNHPIRRLPSQTNRTRKTSMFRGVN